MECTVADESLYKLPLVAADLWSSLPWGESKEWGPAEASGSWGSLPLSPFAMTVVGDSTDGESWASLELEENVKLFIKEANH